MKNNNLGKTEKKLSSYIDHTILKPDASLESVRKICDEAKEYEFASVCVNSCHADFASKQLEGSGVMTCCVVGFPLGAMISKAKAFETTQCIEAGADEVDMVINIGAAKDGNWKLVEADIKQVVDAANKQACVKVIIETCLLTDEEKMQACKCAKSAGADFVKTSTGFSTGGATVKDVALMRKTVGESMGVKASGGIRTKDVALKMIEAGATRLGVSAGIAIVKSLEGNENY